MPRLITAFSNSVVREARALREKKGRRAGGMFLAEGLRILTEARETGRLPHRLFFAAEGGHHPRARALIEETEAAGGEAIETTRDILAKLSGKDNPQALVGVYVATDVPLAEVRRTSADIWIVAQALRDPGNLGTILRIGDAVGAGGLILLDDSVDPFSVEAVRASMGALFTQAIVRTRWPEFLAWLREGAGQLVGLSLDTDTDYRAPTYQPPTFLLVGNEAHGLPDEYAAQSDLLVKLPMLGRADSLNAAVATAVMAYEVLRQRRPLPETPS